MFAHSHCFGVSLKVMQWLKIFSSMVIANCGRCWRISFAIASGPVALFIGVLLIVSCSSVIVIGWVNGS